MEQFNTYFYICATDSNNFAGAYPISDYPRVLIDITSVPELKGCTFDQNLIIGVGITLNELLDVFKATAEDGYFGYLQKFVEHINLVANIPIRNVSYVYSRHTEHTAKHSK